MTENILPDAAGKSSRTITGSDVANMLTFIDPNMPRDDGWLDVVMSVKAALGENGRDIVEDWSEEGDTYDAANFEATWNGINRRGGNGINGRGPIGIPTLLHYATEGGWKPNGTTYLPVEDDDDRSPQQIDTAKSEKNEAAAVTARKRLDAAGDPDPQHPYLQKKGILPIGIKQEGDNLLLPVQDEHGQIVGLQEITPDGDKRFQKGSTTRGGQLPLKGKSNTITICEGYATGVSLHSATDATVVIAYNCGNLMHVAKTIRKNHPDADIVIAADSLPEKTLGKARKAAMAINARLAIPTVDSDFNDMAQAGADVKAAIDTAEVATVWRDPDDLSVIGEHGVPRLKEQRVPSNVRYTVARRKTAFHYLSWSNSSLIWSRTPSTGQWK